MNIPTDGSGRVSVIDISNDTENRNYGLLCRYRAGQVSRNIRPRWRLRGVDIPVEVVDVETNYHGWISKILQSAPHLRMLLQRTQNKTIVEGFFICYYDGDNSISVGVFYPSE